MIHLKRLGIGALVILAMGLLSVGIAEAIQHRPMLIVIPCGVVFSLGALYVIGALFGEVFFDI